MDYIKKDGQIINEIGEFNKWVYPKTVGELREIDIEDVPPRLRNMKRKLDEEKDVKINVDEWKKDVEVIYI